MTMEIVCKYPIELRVDKLLISMFQISRSRVKDMIKEGAIF